MSSINKAIIDRFKEDNPYNLTLMESSILNSFINWLQSYPTSPDKRDYIIESLKTFIFMNRLGDFKLYDADLKLVKLKELFE